MTMLVTNKMKKEDVNKELTRLAVRKRMPAKKFCGAVKWKEDGLKFQQRMRDEWN